MEIYTPYIPHSHCSTEYDYNVIIWFNYQEYAQLSLVEAIPVGSSLSELLDKSKRGVALEGIKMESRNDKGAETQGDKEVESQGDKGAESRDDKEVESQSNKEVESQSDKEAESCADKKAESSTNRMTVIQVDSICVVAMDMPEATPTPNKHRPPTCLITGCSVSIEDNRMPSIIVHTFKQNHFSEDKSKPIVLHTFPPTPDLNDPNIDLYDLFFDQDTPLDPSPIPTLPLPSTISLSHKDGGLPYMCELTASIRLDKYSICTSNVPRINHIIPIPGENVVAVGIGTDSSDGFDKPVGGIVLLMLIETEDGSASYIPYKEMSFVDIDDVVVNMCSLKMADGNDSTRSCLACVTNGGCLKVYDLRSLDVITCYSVEGVVFTHVVSCDRSVGVAFLTTRHGDIQMVALEEVGVAREGDEGVAQVFKGQSYKREHNYCVYTCIVELAIPETLKCRHLQYLYTCIIQTLILGPKSFSITEMNLGNQDTSIIMTL